MDTKKKEASRKLKKVHHESSSSSSSTSSSNSDSGSSSSSSSPDSRHKAKRRNIRKRKNSSSSDGHGKKSISKKHLAHKKPSDAKKVVHKKSSHPGKIRKKVVPAHVTKKVKSLSPVVKSSHKHLKIGTKKEKMLMDPNDGLRERELLQRDREKLRLREKERRSLSPRTPVRRLERDLKKDRTPERRVSSPSSASRYRTGSSRSVKESPLSARRHESTKERERREREAARDKERAEALARCQERQRERERKDIRIRRDRERSIEEEKSEPRHKDRLLPRPSERVRMLNATRNTPEKIMDLDRSRSHSRGRSIRDRLDKDYDRSYIAEQHRERSLEQEYVMSRTPREDEYMRERKMPRDERDYEQERIYEQPHREERRLAPVEYVGGPSRGGYEERHRREPDWEEQPERVGRIFERAEVRPDWERDIPVGHHTKRPDDGFKESRGDWNRQWNEPQEKWSEKREPKEWPKYAEKSWNEPRGIRHEEPPHVPVAHGPIQHSAPRRWPTQPAPAAEWPGTLKTETEYRRPMHTPKMIGEHGAPTTPHPFKRHAGAHPNPFHYNYKRFHFNKRHQQGLNQPTAPVSPSLLNSPGKVLLKTTKLLINAPIVPNSSLAEKMAEAIFKKEPLALEANSEVDKDGSSEGLIDTTTEDAEKSLGGADEEQEDNLSEFSDVDDEILNREEELAAQEAAAAALAAAEATSENGGDSKSHANQELKKEMDLDFEEISDGELEEEAKRHCLADALGVDWASLAKETQRPIEKRQDSSWNSIKTRWTPHKILWDVGVSANMAGEEMAMKAMKNARDKLKQERLERRLKKQPIKKELASNVDEAAVKLEESSEIKQETPEIKQDEPEEPQSDDDDLLLDNDSDILLHPSASVQVYLRKMKAKRQRLIMNATGKYGRALSSHNDLKIRRQLCNLPAKEINMDRNWRPSAELNAQVQLIYQRLISQAG